MGKKEYRMTALTAEAMTAISADGFKVYYLGHYWEDPGCAAQVCQYARVQGPDEKDCLVRVCTSWTYGSWVEETPQSLFFDESADGFFCDYSPGVGDDITPGHVFALARMYWGGATEFPDCFHLDGIVVEEDRNIQWGESGEEV